MMRLQQQPATALKPSISLRLASGLPALARDVPILLAGIAVFYGLLSLGHYWAGPVQSRAEISLNARMLPRYAFFSVARICIAYCFSLVFTLVYAYIAAHNSAAERFMIPLLDTLQSIPVLSFLPGVMLTMIALFPSRQAGLEAGSILLIVTGQVWNMAFSVYSSMKSIPYEMLEAAHVYRLSWWQKFTQLELPFAAIGLVWNSIMSVAGAWFFLMACEMFVLGNRDLRLPGLGSYLQTASDAGDFKAIALGLGTMIFVIVVMDQVIWRPLIAWSDKFKFEQVEASAVPRSPVLDLLRRSMLVKSVRRAVLSPLHETVWLYFARTVPGAHARVPRRSIARGLRRAGLLGLVSVLVFATARMAATVAHMSLPDFEQVCRGTVATFFRVEFALVLAALWTVPAGVYVGLRPKLAAVAQPLAQIAASVPATALFPIVILVLIRAGGGLGIGSIVLLLLGTQWYILFNVIAGASAIPTDLKEVCRIFRLPRIQQWRTLILPALFPQLITGLVTASGGAWNASIVAEYFHFRGRTFSTLGLGAVISLATDTGNIPLLLGATLVMAAVVVTINRLVWRRLYAVAAERFRLDT
ncbi:MAG: ABC transporter permease subunit [Acidobacteriaceae bacterium]|nr:ABC transporter permease subunit [Acidobacteriaceae bacterium]